MQNGWMRHVAAIVVLATASAMAAAQGPAAVRKLAESSLLVTGSIVIEPDGSTGNVAIDKPEALPKEIVGFVTGSIQQWKFKPVEQDGKIVRAKAPMTVRVVAKKAEGDKYAVEIRSASFGDASDGDDSRTDGTTVQASSMPPPRYPQGAVDSGVTGTVFLVIRVDREGKVADLVAEQTNLRVAGSQNDMKKFRKTLEGASIAAARKWRFTPPTVGDSADDDTWSVRVPVSYNLGDPPKNTYGRWETYIPGPRTPVPWASKDDMLAGAAGGADAVGDGRVHQLGRGPQLLTPLGSG